MVRKDEKKKKDPMWLAARYGDVLTLSV